MSNPKVRVVKYWDDTFGRDGYKLQKKVLGIWWTVESDPLGMLVHRWICHYDCEIIHP